VIDVGYACEGWPKSSCLEICGDGKNFGKYACDDGNNQNGDGYNYFGIINI
jgi:cysteine-rich repeat protein